jgi:polysaccharide export outer membrane protein
MALVAVVCGTGCASAPRRSTNTRPVANIDSPKDGTPCVPGERMALVGSARDAQNPDAQLQYQWDIDALSGKSMRRRVQSLRGRTVSFLPTSGTARAFEVRLVVSDPARLRDTAFVHLPVVGAASHPKTLATARPTAASKTLPVHRKPPAQRPAPATARQTSPAPASSTPASMNAVPAPPVATATPPLTSGTDPAPRTPQSTASDSVHAAVSTPDSAAKPAPGEGTYPLGPGDEVHVAIYAGGEKQEDFTGEVAPSGTLTSPLIGEIPVAGLTASEVSDRIRAILKREYFVDPQVMVSVKEFARKVFVSGEVKNPGGYSVEEGLTVMSVCTLAGGFTDFAALNHVKLLRTENGKMRTIDIDLSKVRRGKAPDLAVRAGDRIDVPHRRY